MLRYELPRQDEQRRLNFLNIAPLFPAQEAPPRIESQPYDEELNTFHENTCSICLSE